MSSSVYISESGTFLCDENSIALQFVPAPENQLGDNTFRTFLVPYGVVGFCDEFGRSMRVTERFTLPDSVRYLGVPDWPRACGCVFANTALPTVVIPESVESMGKFAFGGSSIHKLCLAEAYTRQKRAYVREFKDCRIGTLYIHEAAQTDLFSGCRCHVNQVYTYTQRIGNSLPQQCTRVEDIDRFYQKLQYGFNF